MPSDRDGDTLDFDFLYQSYSDRIRAHLLSMVRDHSAVEDLAQEVFFRAWKSLGSLRSPAAARGWLFRIATNCALNHIRGAQTRPRVPLVFATDEDGEEDEWVPAWMADPRTPSPAEQLARAEDVRALSQAVGCLPEEKRVVVHLIHNEGLSVREAAKALGIPEGTVKSRLHYALRHMEGSLKDLEES